MKLLFITQKADRNDDVLGFVHRWIEKLSEKCSLLTVICLEKGEAVLPKNVQILSLGKEHRQSRLEYALRFYKYIWRLRGEYDAVLVHMNPVYVVMGFLFWKLWGKKMFLWYNHEYGNLIAKTSVRCVQRVFYTSPYSFASRYKNSQPMPAGVDTDLFRPDFEKQPENNTLLYVGRIAKIKKVDVLIDALHLLHKKGVQSVLQVVGAPGKDDRDYYSFVKQQASELEQAGRILFAGKIPNRQTPQLYKRSRILFNLSPAGLFDKTVLEAMACGCLVLVSSPAFKEALPGICMFKEADSEDLSRKIEGLLAMSDEQQKEYRKKFRSYAVQNHSLDLLVGKLYQLSSQP